VHAQAHLLEVVAALRAGRGRPHLLDGRQQQADQDGDDRNDDEQLDQREAAPTGPGTGPSEVHAKPSLR
jgi:hypothetical protein